ncbi:GHKL domain-containing protein [Leuconostoc holzapfelii]|uniref:GHKL domain-containing protein n=1 Tax=Leuconostoc holzapfelii TaxID=434464 RepID=A0ABT2NUI6_9LACO|nr:GHKL domain-containing protein [Leuconostoc holzapfelii]MCT8389023.1 GHKL domain-containing protein [Leuconostoc holzapfelii]
MLPILSNITLLLQAIVSVIATIAWFGTLLGAHRLTFSAIWRLALTLLLIDVAQIWLIPPTYQVAVASTLTILSLMSVGLRGHADGRRLVVLLDAILSTLLAAWVVNVTAALEAWLALPAQTAFFCDLLASGLTLVLALIPYRYHFEWLTASFFQQHQQQLCCFLSISVVIRLLNDYLAYLMLTTAYQGSLVWEAASLVVVLIIILIPILRHQYDLLACKLQQRDRMLVATQQYTNQLEKQYLAYRTFRHDYKNILASLAYGIQNENMADVQYAYESVVKTSQRALPQVEALQLHFIADVNLRSALLVKYQEATRHAVNFTIDIQQMFDPKSFVVDVDFFRVFGILLDNAIESAMETPEKLVSVVFIGSEQLAIINSTKQPLDMTKAMLPNYSSKADHAGLGLYFVDQFLARRQDIELITITDKTQVRQELTFGVAS